MIGRTRKQVTVTLTLNEDEARWLKGLIQNPLSDDEPKEWAKYRKDLWDALSEIKEEWEYANTTKRTATD